MSDARGDCYWRKAVACVVMRWKLTNTWTQWCSPSFAECKSARAFFVTQPDDIELRGDCVAK